MKTITISPAVHRRVMDPKTNQPIPEGMTAKVEASSYWLRRLRQGDVVLVEEKPEPVVKKTKSVKSDPVAAAKEE